jgi:hypothetical protein
MISSWLSQSNGMLQVKLNYTSLNLQYIRKLSCKYDLFWLSGSGEDFLKMTSPHFCIFVIISPLKRTWSFIWTIYNPLYSSMIWIKFHWIWHCGSGEDFFFNINICKYSFHTCDITVMWKLEIYKFSAGVLVWKLEIFCRRFYVFIAW